MRAFRLGGEMVCDTFGHCANRLMRNGTDGDHFELFPHALLLAIENGNGRIVNNRIT
jgi:hypothetical protein